MPSTNDQNLPNSRVLTAEAAAAYCASSASAFAKMRCYGGGPRFIKVTASRVGYLREDLDGWLDAKLKRSSTSDREAA